MSLEVKSKSKILINLPFIILALIFAIVTARLYFWEDHYYKSKEGSERMLPKSNLDLETDQKRVFFGRVFHLPWTVMVPA
mgnify:CR=1 FL=1